MNGLKVGYESAKFGYELSEFMWVRNDWIPVYFH